MIEPTTATKVAAIEIVSKEEGEGLLRKCLDPPARAATTNSKYDRNPKHTCCEAKPSEFRDLELGLPNGMVRSRHQNAAVAGEKSLKSRRVAGWGSTTLQRPISGLLYVHRFFVYHQGAGIGSERAVCRLSPCQWIVKVLTR